MSRTIELKSIPSANLNCDLILRGTDTIIENIALTELTNSKTVYQGTIATAAAGIYEIIIKSGANIIGNATVSIAATDPVTYRDIEETTNQSLDVMISANQYTVSALANAPTPSNDTGANTVAITVNDGTNPIQNAKIRVTEVVGGLSHIKNTDTSGQATFNLDNATWTIAVTKTGFQFSGATLVVTAAATPTYSMTATAIPPPADPLQITVQALCVDPAGVPESGVTVKFKILRIPNLDTNYTYDNTEISTTSDTAGIVNATLIRASTIMYRRSLGGWKTTVLPNTPTATLPSIIGG